MSEESSARRIGENTTFLQRVYFNGYISAIIVNTPQLKKIVHSLLNFIISESFTIPLQFRVFKSNLTVKPKSTSPGCCLCIVAPLQSSLINFSDVVAFSSVSFSTNLESNVLEISCN